MEHVVEEDLFAVGLPAGMVLKSTLATEGERRFSYCEPSTEAWDQQNERMLQSALLTSAEHYLRFGNVDLEHLTMIGPRPIEMGGRGMSPEEAARYQIGLPSEIVGDGKRMFMRGDDFIVESNSALKGKPLTLKAAIFSGDGPLAQVANEWWDSQTTLVPPKRWYPSVAGRRPVKDCGPRGCVIKAFKWVNTGYAREPVNQSVKAVSIVPLDEFWKGIVAGHATENLTGGAALRRESLQGSPVHADGYAEAAGRFMRGLRTGGTCEHTRGRQSVAKLVEHFQRCEGLEPERAKDFATRLLRQAGSRFQSNRNNHAAAAA